MSYALLARYAHLRPSHCATSRVGRVRTIAGLPRVRNSLTGSLETLPSPDGPVQASQRWYVCGPTVYDAAHLGHGRTYVTLDLIRRAAEAWLLRAPIQYAMGVTDIDAKIVARAAERGESPRALARRWEAAFFADMAALNVLPPVVATRVTDHIPDIIAYVEGIVRAGLGYVAADGVYFDVAAMGARYGKLKPPNHGGDGGGGEDARGSGAGVKRDPRDFALWKLARPGGAEAPPPEGACWPSPWGSGWPGWHIECSAMTQSVLGPRLDLHAGGIDLAFPHHCNEIAQCEAFHGIGKEDGQRWARLFLHVGHLHIAGRKMSKSLKNFISIADALRGGTASPVANADAFRLYCMQHHYAATLQYSEGEESQLGWLHGEYAQ